MFSVLENRSQKTFGFFNVYFCVNVVCYFFNTSWSQKTFPNVMFLCNVCQRAVVWKFVSTLFLTTNFYDFCSVSISPRPPIFSKHPDRWAVVNQRGSNVKVQWLIPEQNFTILYHPNSVSCLMCSWQSLFLIQIYYHLIIYKQQWVIFFEFRGLTGG